MHKPKEKAKVLRSLAEMVSAMREQVAGISEIYRQVYDVDDFEPDGASEAIDALEEMEQDILSGRIPVE